MERWSSQLGFLLASVGAAVGIGNVWRFSSVVGQNGGGAYLVPYLLAAFAFGVPLMVLEMSVGRSLRADVVTAFRSVDSRFESVGWLVTGAVLLILSYYVVITGWILAFLLYGVADVGTDFAAFTGTYQPLIFFLVVTLTTGGIVSFGVKAGIERLSTTLIPLVFVLLTGLALFVSRMEGFGAGVSFFLTPDFSVLRDPFLWGAAFGQVFFSFSVGQGIMLTYGSYLDEDVDIGRSALLIAVADVAVAVLAGLVIFPIVFTNGLEPTLGVELAFTTLPRAFEAMPYGSVVGPAFFGILFLAAITSAVSMMEVGIASVTGGTRLNRRKATAAVTLFTLVVGLPSALSYTPANLVLLGERFLDLMDETVGTLGLPVSAIVISLVFTWRQERGAVESQVGRGAVLLLTKYAVPVVLTFVTLLKLIGNVDFPAWRWLPGLEFVGSLEQASVALLILGLLYGSGTRLRRYRRRRRNQRRGS